MTRYSRPLAVLTVGGLSLAVARLLVSSPLVGLALIVGVSVMGYLLAVPRYHLVVILFLSMMPSKIFLGARLFIGSVPISLLEIFLVPFLLGAALRLSLLRDRTERKDRLGQLLIVYVVWSSMAATYGLLQGYSLYIIGQEWRYSLYLIGTYIATLLIVRNLNDVKFFMQVILLGALVATGYSLMILVPRMEMAVTLSQVKDIGLPVWMIRDGMIIAVVSSLLGVSLLSRGVYMPLLTGGIVATLLTFTRTYWAGLVIALPLSGWLVFRTRIRKRFSLSVTLALLVLVLLVTMSPFLNPEGRVSKALKFVQYGISSFYNLENDPSFRGRLRDFRYGVPEALTNPILGKGIGYEVAVRYKERFWGYRWGKPGPTRGAGYMENSYLYFLVKMGIPGLIIFLALLVQALRVAYHVFRTSRVRELKVLSLYLFVSLATTALLANTGMAFNYFAAAPWIGFQFAMATVAMRLQSQSDRSET